MESAVIGTIGRIPVRNLWLLMLYASDFRALGNASVALEDNPEDIPDLVAEYLIQAVEQRLRQPLTQGYQHRQADLSRVRGRIDVLGTETRQLLQRGQVACRFEELTLNTPRNAYVKAALQTLAKLVRKSELKAQCSHWVTAMHHRGVTATKPSDTFISTERLGHHDAQDKPMLAAARLAFQLALPTEEAGAHGFLSPDREERWVYKLFEKAVGGFYKMHLPSDWQVKPSRQLQWQISQPSARLESILPVMRTDIVLDNRTLQQRIVIDTKFNVILKKGQYREVLSSGYLYQMYAYLFSQIGQGDDLANHASGVLLHPAIDEHLDESVVIQGHAIRFMTVDLAGGVEQWRRGLLAVVGVATELGFGCAQPTDALKPPPPTTPPPN